MIPRKLQAALPYKDKPNHGIKMSDKKKGTSRVAVVLEPEEQKVIKFLSKTNICYWMVYLIHFCFSGNEYDENDNYGLQTQTGNKEPTTKTKVG